MQVGVVDVYGEWRQADGASWKRFESSGNDKDGGGKGSGAPRACQIGIGNDCGWGADFYGFESNAFAVEPKSFAHDVVVQCAEYVAGAFPARRSQPLWTLAPCDS